MTRFYGHVLGLETLSVRGGGAITFYRIADGHAGHTCVLALFADRDAGPRGTGTGLHHLALSLGWDEQTAAMAWYDRLEQPYRVESFDWIGWRGVFTEDPDGNTVELVAARPDPPRAPLHHRTGDNTALTHPPARGGPGPAP